MRSIFPALAFLLICPVFSRAEETDTNAKLYELATGAGYDDGKLDLWMYMYSESWLNGIYQGEDNYHIVLKKGDEVTCLVCGDRTRFLRYRLDALTPTHALFTRWIYSVHRTQPDENTRKYELGRLMITDRYDLDLTKPNGLLVDYGPNNLQFSGKMTPRSK